ncbi:MAG: hypothetical protein HY647_12780 [Acidobacteria bacterium]|nr:hypothetical protein [Acidobacteriota bacterium]
MKILIYCMCLVGFTTALRAETYCSLVVKVFNFAGRDVSPSTYIAVEERDGQRRENKGEEGGTRFCGLGITPVSVTVRAPMCPHHMVIRDFPLEWDETKTLSVIYDFEPCTIKDGIFTGCRFVFRIVDSLGNPIKGASLKVQSPYERTLEADEFGRILARGVGFGKELVGTGIAEGRDPVELTIPCTGEKYWVEEKVTMAQAK